MLTAPAIDRISVTLVPSHLGRSPSPERARDRFRMLLVQNYGPRARIAAETILQADDVAEALHRMASFLRTKPHAHKGA